MTTSFPTTRWTLVIQASDTNSPERISALSELMQANWFPLYTFLRRSGKQAHEAEDLIQGFFTKFLERNLLEGVHGAKRGRFRNFLLICLKHYVASEYRKLNAQKRGGGAKHLAIDFEDADRRFKIEPHHELTPERAFDRSWAVEIVQRGLDRVGRAWHASGKGEKFEALKVFLVADDQAPSQENVAENLGMPASTLRVNIHRLRGDFRKAICAEVADTLEKGDLLEDEINHLFSALNTKQV